MEQQGYPVKGKGVLLTVPAKILKLVKGIYIRESSCLYIHKAMRSARELATNKGYKLAFVVFIAVPLIALSALLVAWSEIAWPFVLFILYLLLAISVGLRSGFALLLLMICMQPLIPYYPITALRGAALQDLFFLSGLPLLLLSIPLKKERLRTVFPIALPYLVLAGWAAISALATQDNLTDFLVALAKGSGRPTIIALASIAVGAALRDFKRSEILYKCIVLTATFEALIGIIAMIFNIEVVAGGLHLGVQNLPYQLAPGLALSRRLQGTFSTANLTGAYFLVALPLTLSLFLLAKDMKLKVLWFSCGLLQLLALVLTFTRASLVASIFALMIFGLIYSGRGRLKVFFQILIILMIVYSLLDSVSPEIMSILQARFAYARAETRLAPAWAGLRMIQDYPLWGVGVDNSVPLMETNPRYSVTPFGETTVRPHNSFIFIGAELGLPASFILLWVVIAITKFVVRARRLSIDTKAKVLSAAIISGWIGEILHSLTNNLFHHPSLMVTHISVIAALTPLFLEQAQFSPQNLEKE